MSKGSGKKKKPLNKPTKVSKEVSSSARKQRNPASYASGEVTLLGHICCYCEVDLRSEDKALFVEEDVGRIFCSEDCIVNYFRPEIERLESEYFNLIPKHELSEDDREKLIHLRYECLENPDEIWREKTITGDNRFCLISEFNHGTIAVWCVCISLFLKGEPSFLYLSFMTNSTSLIDYYRRGERMEWVVNENKEMELSSEVDDELEEDTKLEVNGSQFIDGLADPWTDSETLRAKNLQERVASDIQLKDFHKHNEKLHATLQDPDEVWVIESQDESPLAFYHFLKLYKTSSDKKENGLWYIVIARESENDEEQLEIIDCFPTRDYSMADRYRVGRQEVGDETVSTSSNRMVH